MTDNIIDPDDLISELKLTSDLLDPMRLQSMDDDTLIVEHRSLDAILSRITEALRLLSAAQVTTIKDKNKVDEEKKALISAIDALRNLSVIHHEASYGGNDDE